jgi:hypothetical protein
VTPSARASFPMLSTEMFRSPRSTDPTNVLCNPARSARASWLRPRLVRVRLRFSASVVRRGSAEVFTRGVNPVDANASTAFK